MSIAHDPTPPASLPPPAHAHSIEQFFTDGSLAALCDELSRLSGVGVDLRDSSGRKVIPRPPGDTAPPAWRILDLAPAPPGATVIPMLLGEQAIGSLVLHAGTPVLGAHARARLERLVALLASTAAELCRDELDLAHRRKEIDALGRMSSLLVRAAGPERVLDVALESVLDALDLHAGSIMLLREEADAVRGESEDDLVRKASRNLSQDWLDCPYPLSKDRLFDRQALAGEIVVAEDLARDERVLIPDRVAAEGLVAAIHVGLVFKSRPLGIMRLYSRTPRVFTESDKRVLASVAEQAAVAIEQSRLLRFEREEQRVQRQLQLAADVQRRMLPRALPSLRGFDLAARYIPSFELGGDYYDFIDLGGHLGIVVGDVVGKGIAAALLMSALRASLRAHVQELYDIDEIVSRVNQALYRDTREEEFASLWYGVIDPARLRLTYCSAGHEPTLVIRVPKNRAPTNADIDELTVGGMVVGIEPTQRYQRAVFDLKPRDVLIAYTDGLPDTRNFQGERFGKKRLRAAVLHILAAEPDASAARIVEQILWHLRQFAGLTPRPDDTTILAVRVLENP
ncbi:MAG: SpoIIE family protein phosphatase [Phycisphaerales bacterium]|nr:SpoIIE family protein phosphatase [Phycisphaerales bacterium]